MKTVWKIVRWSALLFVVGLVLLVGGGLLFLQTQQFRALARDQVVGTLNETLTGTISLERIEGTLWGSLILDNVGLEYDGETLVHIPQVIARYNLRPLLDGRVEVSQITLLKPVIHLEQDAQGNLNILEAVSPRTHEETGETEETPEEEETSQSSLVIALESVEIQAGAMSFRLPDQAYQLEDIDLDAQLDIVPAGLKATVRNFSLRALAQGLPPVSLAVAASYQNTATPPSAQIEHLRLETDASQLQLTGSVNNLDMPQTKLDTHLELTLEKLALVDILQLAPDVPLKHDIAGHIRVTGSLGDLHTTALIKTADATIQVKAQANLNQDAQAYQTYQATVSLTQLDIPQLIRDVGDVRAVVDGTLQARGVGASFPSLEATTDLAISGLQVADMQLGTVSVQGSIAHEMATLSGELTGSVGHATWQATLALPEPPRYDLSFAADHLSLQKVAAGQESLGGELNVSGTVQGTGFDLPSMHTQADLTIQPSTVGPVQVTHGRFIAQITNGRIHLSEGTLITPDASVSIEGELGTALEEIGQLSYSLQVDQLTPWLALAGQDGSGQIALKGAATGSLANLQTEGTLRAKALTLPGFTLANAAMQFQAAELGQAHPQATVSVRLTDLDAGLALQSVDADIQLLPVQTADTQRVHISLKAQEKEAPQRRHRLQAEVLAQADQIHAQLQELSLALPIGTWQLARPVTIQHQPSGLSIDRFVLTNQAQQNQQILLNGSVSTTGPQDLQLQITDFFLDNLKDFLPPGLEVSGIFSADIQLAGTAAVPTISGQAGLDALKIASQAYEGLKTRIDYQQKKVCLDLTFQQDTDHTLQAKGCLPISLSWANGFQSALVGEPSFHVHSEGLSLAFLNGLSGKSVHDIGGEIHLDIKADGPVEKPRVNGTFGLKGGQATVKPLGLTVAPITLTGTVSPEQIQITQLSAKAREGTFETQATFALKDDQPEILDLSMTADHWPVIWTRQYQVEIDSQIKAEGPLKAPTVTGQVDVWQATLQPTLSFLSAHPLSRDETIIVRSSAEAPPMTEATPETTSAATPPEGDPFLNLAMQLAIHLHQNTRILHQNANITLTGDLDVSKKRGEDPRVAGAIALPRGWVGFQGHRFELDQGKITFTGETKINPRLDIVAQYEHEDYRIDAVVSGTREEPSLDLRSNPALEQADILSVLLFGKPASALGKGEQANLQQQAVSLTGYAASAIGRSVADALGLSELGLGLGLNLSDVGFSGEQVRFGRNLNRKTRISASHSMGGKAGQEVAIDYEISPNIDLRTTTSSKGSSGADIIWRQRY